MQSDGGGKLTAAGEDAMAEQILDAVNPIRDGAVADVQHPRGGGGVQTVLQLASERVAQHPGPCVLRGQRTQLVPDEAARGTDVAQQRRLERDVVIAGHPVRQVRGDPVGGQRLLVAVAEPGDAPCSLADRVASPVRSPRPHGVVPLVVLGAT